MGADWYKFTLRVRYIVTSRATNNNFDPTSSA
jgi:hypothetical protein